ncbi:hypothetical protein Pan153_52840 [Gimesia panareensis]|uniref:Uncharacterized protein n=1 Tax=Gimesia panareensis TaxID=2527978 RepID=A0A518FW76_9PLAN|nr:hypothetical protein Pan153_52840 [Gimesia panareensis]
MYNELNSYLNDTVEDLTVCMFLWFYNSLNRVKRELLSRSDTMIVYDNLASPGTM